MRSLASQEKKGRSRFLWMNAFQLVQADLQREGIVQRWDGDQDYSSFYCIYLKTILLKLTVDYILDLDPNDFFDQSLEN